MRGKYNPSFDFVIPFLRGIRSVRLCHVRSVLQQFVRWLAADMPANCLDATEAASANSVICAGYPGKQSACGFGYSVVVGVDGVSLAGCELGAGAGAGAGAGVAAGAGAGAAALVASAFAALRRPRNPP